MSVSVPPAQADGQGVRTYWLHVPRGFRPGQPDALVIAFHGAGGTGLGMEAQTGLSSLADRRGFLVAYAQGLPQPKGSRNFYWYTSGPRDPDAHGIDDGLYASDVISAVQAHYCVDPRRIGAVGFSNGAGLVGYLACVLSGRISAFVAVEAEFFRDPEGCRPDHPASVLDIHARDDFVAPYAGVPARDSPDYFASAVPTWLDEWARRDGCATSTSSVGPGVQVQDWTACDGGAVVFGELRNHGAHTWPATLAGDPGSQAIVRFLVGHPLDAITGAWSAHLPQGIPVVRGSRPPVRRITAFQLPSPHAEPVDIAIARDGDVWFTEFDADKIERIDRSGRLHEYPVRTPDAEPYQLIARPDGTIYFTEYNTRAIGRISGDGRVSEKAIAARGTGGLGITAVGRSVWIADPAGTVDELPAHGAVQPIAVPASAGVPFALAPGIPANSVWLSPVTGYFERTRELLRLGGSPQTDSIVRLPSPASDVDALADGPGNTVWATDYGTGQIDEVTPGGTVRHFEDPVRYGGLSDITRGPDGAMWFTDQAGVIGRITMSGAIQELPLPTAGSQPDGIASAPDGSIWVADPGTNRILHLTLRSLDGRLAPFPPS